MVDSVARSLRGGPLGSRDIQARSGLSQATVSRALTALAGRGHIVRIGRARATRYGLARELSFRIDRLPVYRVDETGLPHRAGELAPIHPGGYALLTDDSAGFPLRAAFFDGLPFHLSQGRPEGFLGRLIARRVSADLGLSADVRDWSDDDLLHYMSLFGDDLPGGWIIGERALERFLKNEPHPVSLVPAELLRLAEAVGLGPPPGSSAGGEQPKFTALFERTATDGRFGEPAFFHAIVKFSEAPTDPVRTRWRDLLIAEYHALATLRAAGIDSSPAELHEHAGRVFLVVPRFDRVGPTGRRPYLALGAVDDEFIGRRDHVRLSAQRLAARGIISPADARTVEIVSLFGDLIGNTDQHFGNTSFSWNSEGFMLAPAYDVLPMWYAPRAQGLIARDAHEMPVELPEWRASLAIAGPLARAFWEQVASDGRISRDFRSLARGNIKRVGR